MRDRFVSYEELRRMRTDVRIERHDQKHRTQSQTVGHCLTVGNVHAPYVECPASDNYIPAVLQSDRRLAPGTTTIRFGKKAEKYAFATLVDDEKAKLRLLRKFLFPRDLKKVLRCSVKISRIIFAFRYELCSMENEAGFKRKPIVAAYMDEVKGIPPELLKHVSGVSLLCEDGRLLRENGRVQPVANLYHPNIREISERFLDIHQNRLHNIAFQRQSVEAIPIQEMIGVYKNFSFPFYLMGTQHKVYIPHNSNKKLRFLNSSYS